MISNYKMALSSPISNLSNERGSNSGWNFFK